MGIQDNLQKDLRFLKRVGNPSDWVLQDAKVLKTSGGYITSFDLVMQVAYFLIEILSPIQLSCIWSWCP